MHVKEKAGGALDKGNLYLGCDMSWKSWMAAAKGNITSGTSEWVIFNDLSLTVRCAWQLQRTHLFLCDKETPTYINR